ncbi:MAG: hypothetical protein ACTHLW_21325, partial [Verrucomicrobiota bacterium]
NGNKTNFTFQGDTTYYVSGVVTVYGDFTVEGGTVVKFNPSTFSSVAVYADNVYCKTGPYRPAVFTSMHDNTAGETVSGSTGQPYIDSQTMYLDFHSCDLNLHDLRMLYSWDPLNTWSCSLVLRDSQFVHNDYPFWFNDTDPCVVENVLVDHSTSDVFYLSSAHVAAAYLTLHDVSSLWYNDFSSSVAVTNSLLVTVTNWGGAFLGCNNVSNNTGTGVFQIVGGGRNYLAASSSYRNAGTTNVSAELLADLQSKTTYPPIAYTNATFTTVQTFSPQAQRDIDTPDLGYHYDPLDYVFGGCTATTNMTFTTGAVAGWFRTGSTWYHGGQAIRMVGNTVVSFEGTVEAPAYWVRLNTVQEQDKTAGYGHGSIENWEDPYLPLVRGKFLRCSALANEAFNGYFSGDYGPIRSEMTDSEFWAGSFATYGDPLYFTNCLMRRVLVGVNNGNNRFGLGFRNCTFEGGSFFTARNSAGPLPVSVRDCAFDGTSISTADYYGSNSSLSDYDYNAYTNATSPFSIGGTHDKKGVAFNWQAWKLGDYYLPTNSALTNAGSRTADLVGLYHYTTQTNQVKEGNSTVDIGYHYVAVDSYGSPMDIEGDSVSDYLEDANGNGVVDTGESSWLLNAYNGLSVGAGLKVFTPLK